jgi:catechol 2,3-dioxygenase-like lactoylglutathione lyase family enzyme
VATRSRNFDIRGYNHVALVCADMKKTVDFYEGLLGFPLIKTLEFPGGGGQHFFFQVTKDDGVAFFWFPGGPGAAPGIAGAGWGRVDEDGNRLPGMGGSSAPTSMHHLSFGVDAEKLDEYRERLQEAGIEVTEVVRHAATGADGEQEIVRSLYFPDPDGIVLEFSAWTGADEEAGARRRIPAEV